MLELRRRRRAPALAPGLLHEALHLRRGDRDDAVGGGGGRPGLGEGGLDGEEPPAEQQEVEQRDAQRLRRLARFHGRYQMGEVQARSWIVRTWSGAQQGARPSPIVAGSSQRTPRATHSFWLQRQVGFSTTRA